MPLTKFPGMLASLSSGWTKGYQLNAAETYATIHLESGMRYQHSSPGSQLAQAFDALRLMLRESLVGRELREGTGEVRTRLDNSAQRQ
jgi:hypothetical protein